MVKYSGSYSISIHNIKDLKEQRSSQSDLNNKLNNRIMTSFW